MGTFYLFDVWERIERFVAFDRSFIFLSIDFSALVALQSGILCGRSVRAQEVCVAPFGKLYANYMIINHMSSTK